MFSRGSLALIEHHYLLYLQSSTNPVRIMITPQYEIDFKSMIVYQVDQQTGEKKRFRVMRQTSRRY